jgi:hypothetical protein
VTGSVEIREGSGRTSTLYVRQGLPVHVIRPDTLDRLDLVLVEAGLLSPADVARAQAVREGTGKLMGQVLRDLGLVQPRGLSEALRLQLKRKVTRLFSSGDGTFAISQAEHPFGRDEESPGAPVDGRALVFPGILATYPQRRLAAELADLSGRRVRLGPVTAAQLNELGFNATHAPLLLHLRRSGFLLQDEWIHRDVAGPRAREAKAVLLSLLYLDLLEFPRAEEAAPAAPLAMAPRSPTPVPELDPVHLFVLAQGFFRHGDLNRAEETFEILARLEANNHRVRGFLTWLQFWKKQGADREAALELTLKVMREIVRAEPTFALGHYFIGALFKLRNDMNRAENAFRAAVSHDPDLFDAQRELRLLALRRARR